MVEIEKILDKLNKNSELRKTFIPLFIGNPGIGKSKRIYKWAQKNKKNVIEMITSTMNPFEISGIAIPDKDDKKMTIYDFDKLDSLNDGDILFFDELLNGNPATLNACLTLLESRKTISGKPLPDVIIVAAANPQGMTPLTPQVKERFVWYEMKLDKESFSKHLKEKYVIPRGLINNLLKLITSEDFISRKNNFFSARSVDKMINAYINDLPIPESYRDFIIPTLEYFVTNTTEEDIILSKDKVLKPNEKILWLDLYKYKKQQENENIKK